jgi:4-amino-4-deoxy-L-arabinose transferase-like glycosyltransferase
MAMMILAACWYFTNLNGYLENDEVRYATTGYYAIKYGQLLDLGVTNNPPLIKYFMGISQFIFGVDSFAIRLPSALFGLGALLLTYLIGRERSSLMGLCASGLLLLTWGFSRFAILGFLDMGLTFFILLAAFIFIKFKDNKWFPLLLGISCGLIMTSKFTGIYTLVPIIVFAGYLGFRKKSLRIPLIFFASLAGTIAIIYLPYLIENPVLLFKTMVYTALSPESELLQNGIGTVFYWFFSMQNFYNPLYAIGLCVAVVYLIASKDINKKFISAIALSNYLGIYFLGQVTWRFMLPMLPFLSLLFFDLLQTATNKIADRIKTVKAKKYANWLSPVILIALLVSPYGWVRPVNIVDVFEPSEVAGQPPSLMRNMNVAWDSNIDLVINKILIYAQNKSHITVATTRQPLLLYYLGAPPETYVNSPKSPDPPSSIYNYTVNVNGTDITLLWFGVNDDTDAEILNLVQQDQVDLIIVNKSGISMTDMEKEILSYSDRHALISRGSSRHGTIYTIYWMISKDGG